MDRVGAVIAADDSSIQLLRFVRLFLGRIQAGELQSQVIIVGVGCHHRVQLAFRRAGTAACEQKVDESRSDLRVPRQRIQTVA